MASQVEGCTSKGGEEGSASFDFETWIIQNEFECIKSAFIERKMNKLDTLSMDNTNFVSLLSDYRVLQNAHLIPKIASAIQGLKPLQQAAKQTESAPQLFFMNKKEEMIFKQMRKYPKDMDVLNDEHKEMT